MGTIVSGGLGSPATDTETYTYDYSRAFGGSADYSTGSFGSKVNVGDATGATIMVADPGAIAAGKDIALAGLAGNEAILTKVAGSAENAVSKALDLVSTVKQGDVGTIIRGVIWLVAIVAAGWALLAFFKRPKEKEKDKS